MQPITNRVPIIIDAQKMKSARARRALTQEALAHQARVNVRTIQRAENGAPLRHETLADIAAVLGMPPSGLIRPAPVKEDEVIAAELGHDENTGNVLRRVDTAEVVVRSLEMSVMSELSCAANPTPEIMPTLRSIIGHLEELMRSPFDEEEPAPLKFGSVVTRLEAVAKLNGHLVELEREGLALYLAPVSVFVRIPYWAEEGHWAISLRHSPQHKTAARLHIAEYVSERVRLPEYTSWPLDLCEDDDNIPF